MVINTSNEPFCVTAYTMHEKPLCMSTASASWMKDTLWEMNRIIVKPHMRRKGIGTALMKALYEEAKKNGATDIYVIPGGYDITYEEQVAFYKSVGFIDSKYNKEKILARNL